MRPLSVFLAFILLCTAAPSGDAHAQFWKSLFGKKEKPVKRPVRPKSSFVAKSPAAAPKKKQPEPPRLAASAKKDHYRVDVLAPLYLNELVVNGRPVFKSHLPDKVLPGLSFYQGIKLAADTLNAFGYRLDVFVHDIGDPAHSVDALIKSATLDSADLIIGAVQGTQVAPLAAFARRHTINFISALSPADGGVKGNLYLSLLQPSLQRHCEAIRDAVSRKSRLSNILVIRRSNVPADEACFKSITHDSAFAYVKVMMNTPMPTANLRNFLDSNNDNVIVIPVLDAAYAATLLEQLNSSFPGYRIEVFGMPSWKGIATLHKEGALSNIGVTIGAPFYFDPSASAGREFSEAFSAAYGGKPTEMAFRGYETLFWYAYLLKRYGTLFNDYYGDTGAAPFTRFELKQSMDKDGTAAYYENKHIYLYRYQGGSFSVQQ